MRTQQTLHFLGLNLYSARTNHVVFAPENAETATVGGYLGNVVGSQWFGTDKRSIYHQATVGIQRHADRLERHVIRTRILAVDAPQGDMRQGLGHAIRAPYRMGKGLQPALQSVVDCASADYQMACLTKQLRLFCHLQTVIYLHRNHRDEVETAIGESVGTAYERCHRMSARLYFRQFQSALHRPHRHHLARDIV